MYNMTATYKSVVSQLETNLDNNLKENGEYDRNSIVTDNKFSDVGNIPSSLDSGFGSTNNVTDLDELDSCNDDLDSFNHTHIVTTCTLERVNSLEVDGFSINGVNPSKIIKAISLFITVIVMLFLGVANTTELISFSNMSSSNLGVRDCITISNDCSCVFNITEDMIDVGKSNVPMFNISECNTVKQIVLESLPKYDIRATMCQLHDGYVFMDIRKFENGFPTLNGFYINGKWWFDLLVDYIETINVFTNLIDK